MTSPQHSYGWATAAPPESLAYLAPRLMRILRTLEVQRVVDIGSGNGALAAALAENGFQAIGVEPDRQGFDIARGAYPRIHFYNLSVEDDPNQVVSAELDLFDAAVSSEVVEHLFSPEYLPLFARSLLRENGYLVITTPYHGYLKNLMISLCGRWDKHHTTLWNGGHIKFWSRRTLTRLLQKTGYTVIGFRGVGRLPWLWKSMIMVARLPSKDIA